MSTITTGRGRTGAVDAIAHLIDSGVRFGADLIDVFEGTRTSGVTEAFQRLLPAVRMTPRCGCEIPPPCWLPRQLGEVRSHVCPGGTATIRIRVTNCGATPRAIMFEAVPATAGATITPGDLPLGPMERGVSVAALAVPATAASGEEREALLWIRGCNDHVLRWTVKVASRGADSCHEVDVEDCPDLIHHWYDHFYCHRPCLHGND